MTVAHPTLFAEFAELDLRGLTIQQRFELVHEANPWLYRRIVQLARDLSASGRRHISMRDLFGVLRFEWHIAIHDPNSKWMLNNDYTSRYVRLIEANEPDLVGVFEKRELKS